MLDFHIASPQEKRDVFASVHGIWPHADDPEVHLEKRTHSIQHARAEWFVGVKAGELMTSCGAYPLRLYGPDGEREARGFGAVYTNPKFRGQGHAEALLRFVMAYYQNQKIEDFILFSDIAPAYYERIGFHLLPSWQWEIEAKALPVDSPWALQKTQVLAENPGNVSCDYGIQRSTSDDVWVLAKQGIPLRKTLFCNATDNRSLWIVSTRAGQIYSLLESNIPQDQEHWALFSSLVAADSAKAKCRKARGWWAATPQGTALSPNLSPRKDGILMWTSSRGETDPWLPQICRKAFRCFLSEQF
ncbi:MAG: GNAT family N-acetyltransferase [Oligoflexus sp.]|nr:GNAT family N-acetyltransferase [Oligoflexus sp.]